MHVCKKTGTRNNKFMEIIMCGKNTEIAKKKTNVQMGHDPCYWYQKVHVQKMHSSMWGPLLGSTQIIRGSE